MIERDAHIPALEEVMAELEHAKHIAYDIFDKNQLRVAHV